MNEGNKLKLDFWLKHLVPVIEEISNTGITNEVNTKFWGDIYKYTDIGSGSPIISGWINVFFPYFAEGEHEDFQYMTTDNIPK